VNRYVNGQQEETKRERLERIRDRLERAKFDQFAAHELRTALIGIIEVLMGPKKR